MNWRRAAIGMGVAVPVIALLAYGMTLDPNAIPSVIPGKTAPVFALPVMDAEDADSAWLARHRGKVVVLNFWASWCLGCRDEHTDLSMTAAAYESQGVHFYGVLYKDTPGNARDWIATMGGQSYPTLLDQGSRTAIDYGVSKVPETVVIGPDGVVAYKHMGPITASKLAEVIEPLLAPRAAATAPEITP